MIQFTTDLICSLYALANAKILTPFQHSLASPSAVIIEDFLFFGNLNRAASETQPYCTSSMQRI